MADTSGCCGGRHGKHLDGCIGPGAGRREAQRRVTKTAEFQNAKDRDKENFNRMADQFIAKHPHGSPHYTPNPYPGVTCASRPDRRGRYLYIRK
jgi:hypothetical protein